VRVGSVAVLWVSVWVSVLGACAAAPGSESGLFDWQLPVGFEPPAAVSDNPMNAAKVELGRHLFYDPRLSRTGEQSCGSCHRQELAFSDGRERALGSTGQEHPRNTPTLANVAYMQTLTWANPVLRDLETQALVPLFGERPVELGIAGVVDEVLARLANDPMYPSLFAEAFVELEAPSEALSMRGVTHALSAFQRTLISGRSAYDRHLAGEAEALSPRAQRGLMLFESERLGCSGCHSGQNLSDATVGQAARAENTFHNTGLYDIDGEGSYPEASPGLVAFTDRDTDRGRFRTPTLRNIALTAPYMHDGSIATLDAVLDHYAAGGRSDNAFKSERLRGFELSAEERAEVLAFLGALSDEAFVCDAALSDPWRPRDGACQEDVTLSRPQALP